MNDSTGSKLVNPRELKRICIVSHSAGLAGAERVLIEMTQVLTDAGVECTVIVPAKGPLQARLAELQVKTVVVPYRWWVGTRSRVIRAMRLPLHFLAAWQLSRLPAVRQSDAVLTNSAATPVGALAAWLAHRPHVWYVHEFMQADHGLTYDFGEFLHRKTVAALSTRIVVNSHAVERDWLHARGSDPLDVIYYWVNVPSNQGAGHRCEAAAGVANGPLRVLVVGRLEPGKNQLEAVRSVEILRKQGVDLHLTMLGGVNDSAYFEGIQQAIRQADLGAYITHAGYSADPVPYYLNTNVVVVCSRSEAFGRVAIEAMKMERAVIGAAAAATAELIRDGATGLLYKLGSPASLAEKLSDLARNPSRIRMLGAAGQQWALERCNRARFSRELLRSLHAAVQQYGAASG